MTAAAFEARLCPTWLNEIKKTKLYSHTSPAAGINFLLCVVPLVPSLLFALFKVANDFVGREYIVSLVLNSYFK